MQFLNVKKEIKISDNTFKKILKDFKTELKEYKSQIKKLEQIDYNYNKKVIDIDVLIDTVDLFKDATILNKQTENIIVCYNGNPNTTIQLLFMALQNCKMINLVIDDLCFGVNKLIVTLFEEILKDYKINGIVSFNNFERKNDFKNIEFIDKVYFLGDSNLYTLCKNVVKVENVYIPLDSIKIYCENEKYAELVRKTLEFCYENNIEVDVYESESFDIVKGSINNEETYCSLILSDNTEIIDRFKMEINCKNIYVNENPFRNKIEVVPNIFI